MSLANFPAEIISNLTNFISLTDLVILHACGDRILNRRLEKSPTSVWVVSHRCSLYYNDMVRARFQMIVRVGYTAPAIIGTLGFIPETTKEVITSSKIYCHIPASVDVLDAYSLSPNVTFDRAPGELEVIVRMTDHYDNPSHPEYITWLKDNYDYNAKMVNLKEITLPGDIVSPKSDLIIHRSNDECMHYGIREKEVGIHNMWSGFYCAKCEKLITVISRDRNVCAEIPPCSSLLIRDTPFDKVKTILSKTPERINAIIIKANVDQMNTYIALGILDLLPKLVGSVTLDLVTDGLPMYMWKFNGVSKTHPFPITINSLSYNPISVGDFTGIDTCVCEIEGGTESKKKIAARYPRLSIY